MSDSDCLLSRFRFLSLLVFHCHQFDSYFSLFAVFPRALSLTGDKIRLYSESALCCLILSRLRFCDALKYSNFRAVDPSPLGMSGRSLIRYCGLAERVECGSFVDSFGVSSLDPWKSLQIDHNSK
jgi:hypothetical protein